jgi:hypothetical protein
MIKITESLDSKSLAERSMITESTRIDWPDKKDLPSPTQVVALNNLIASKYPALAATD